MKRQLMGVGWTSFGPPTCSASSHFFLGLFIKVILTSDYLPDYMDRVSD
jgi:hypothetical protein